VLIAIFHAHGGHRRAASAGLWPRPSAACVAAPRVPPHGRHARPLVLVHVTDLHISDVDGPASKQNAMSLMRDVLPRFAGIADVVAITGDLVDAKAYPPWPLKPFLGYWSVQSVDEWRWYSETAVAAAARLGNTTLWITVPGNHDVFGGRKLFDEYGLSPPPPPVPAEAAGRVRVFPVGGHTVVALDPTLAPSPHRPLNFFGLLDRRAARRLREAAAASDPSGTFVSLSHYPSAVMASGRALGDAVGGGAAPRPSVVLSGHLHTLRRLSAGGMQAVSEGGRLELQLPDLFSAGAFRVFTVSDGLPSWTDFNIGLDASRPLVVAMNLPRAGLCAPGAGYAALRSSHIRLLVVAAEAQTVRVHIDGSLVGDAARAADSGRADHIFAVPWDGRQYWGDGQVHALDVLVDGEPCLHHLFALDGRRPSGWAAMVKSVAGAFFTLSDFESIARRSVYFGLLSTGGIGLFMLAALPGVRPQALCICLTSGWLAGGGPLLVAVDLTDAGGYGTVSLRRTVVRDGVLRDAVDPFFAMFFLVIFAMLPSFYCLCVVAWTPDLARSRLLFVIRMAACVRSAAWTLNIAGAHGFAAASTSPSCLPLSLLVVWCSLNPRTSRATYRARAKEKRV
jgi:hypothetical protein